MSSQKIRTVFKIDTQRQFPDTSFHKKEVLIISILTIDSAYGISLLFSDLFYVSPIISSI